MRRFHLLAMLLCCFWATSALAEPHANPKVNLSKLIQPGNLPVRVHVYEDFETDIEKRWWLRGTLETKNVPPSLSATLPNKRCLRAALTKDFDRKMGDPTKDYKAVVFNPVPGPPMAGKTRLSFRYWIKGTDSLRVQIYSLSNNYHRHLILKDLPQEQWQSGCVDMTTARRPDGSGGPLSKDERIDDIQFYIPTDAELLIDDIVLYEAAPEKETRAHFARPIFTGWFDTGKQGQEWPGDFEIVLHQKPLTWDAAKSVVNPDTKRPWIRVSMRGLRPLGKQTYLRFRCHLTGTDTLLVSLRNSKTSINQVAKILEVSNGRWLEMNLQFGSLQNTAADEILFELPAAGTLLIDDVLLYEPNLNAPQ